MGRISLRQRVLNTFREYGGWWQVDRMAEWLYVDVEKVRKIYDALEKGGLMERKPPTNPVKGK